MAGSLNELATGVNVMLLVLCGALVFIMHGGFAMVSTVRGVDFGDPRSWVSRHWLSPRAPARGRAQPPNVV
eukprot:363488-Chlamydomonas_euryale.AAC.11